MARDADAEPVQDPNAALDDVTCVTTRECFAVGFYETAFSRRRAPRREVGREALDVIRFPHPTPLPLSRTRLRIVPVGELLHRRR